MIKKLSVGFAALAAMGIAGAASAQGTTTVNINVAEVFDFAVDDATIELNLTGANPENSDAAVSGISYNSNIEVDLFAEVTGGWPAVGSALGDELFLHIFGGTSDVAAAEAGLLVSASNPPGAASWSISNDGVQQLIGSNLAIQPVWGSHFDIVYIATAQNEMPAPDTYSLEVVYTFTGS